MIAIMKQTVTSRPFCLCLLAALAIAASAPCVYAGTDPTSQQEVNRPTDSESSPDFRTMVGHMTDSKKYRVILEDFVAAAADGNLPALILLISSTVTETVGEQEIAESLSRTVIPFFSNYEKLHNVSATNPAVDAAGNPRGYCFYTYIKTASGKAHPFSICVIDDAGTLKVASVIVDKCRVGRHPFCP